MRDFFLRSLSGFLALCLLNCSVDAPDATFSSANEDLHYNEQESLVELIVEKGMGYDDAIPECDDHDDEDAQGKKFSVDFFLVPSRETGHKILTSEKTHTPGHPVLPFPDLRPVISSPPPEA